MIPLKSLGKFNFSELKPGSPDNPNSKTEIIFPQNYLMVYHGGLDRFVPLLRGGSSVELHLQDFNELPKNQKEYDTFLDWKKTLDSNNILSMAHIPFVKMREDDISKHTMFDLDFIWPIVPQEYVGKTVAKIPPIQNNPAKDLKAYEIDSNLVLDSIDFFTDLGINTLTIHASKFGVYFNDKDLDNYISKIKSYQNYASSKTANIAVETGGLSLEQIVKVQKEANCKINLDTAHLFLDLYHFHSLEYNSEDLNKTNIQRELIQKANEGVVNFFRDYKKDIDVLHLTQTRIGKDLHAGLFEAGALTCNEPIIWEVNEEFKKGNFFYWMVESKADKRNFYHVNKVLKGKQGNIFSKEKTSTYVFMGLPSSGKSTSRKLLAPHINGVEFISDKIHNQNDNSVISAIVDQYVSEEQKDEVYNDIFLGALDYISKKQDVTVDATFHLKYRREKLADILEDSDDIYVFVHQADLPVLKGRFKGREKEYNQKIKNGENVPYGIWTWKAMKKHILPKYDPISIGEFEGKGVHLLVYDTGKQDIQLYNPDVTLRNLAWEIADHYKDDHNVTILEK